MHFHLEVIFKEQPDDVEAAVDRVMAPHIERSTDELDGDGEKKWTGWWDWYQIGGRWTGTHCKGYDPNKDEKKLRTCVLCEGTGTRPGGREQFGEDWYNWSKGCNGCLGTGKELTWPTSWGPHDTDACCSTQLEPDLELSAYRVIFADTGEMLTKDRWNGETIEQTDFDGKILPLLKARGLEKAFLVTVDYHS